MISITRYVTWNLDERTSGALSRALPDQTDLVAIYQATVEAANGEGEKDEAKDAPKGKDVFKPKSKGGAGVVTKAEPLKPMKRNTDGDYRKLLNLVEEALMQRDDNRSNLVIGGLVQHIIGSWRDQFCRSVVSKFNCYFMLPFVDEFHRYIRNELRSLYDGEQTGFTDVFDLTAVRRSLQTHHEELKNECNANKRLQDQFQMCAKMMQSNKDGKPSHGGFEDDL